MHRIETLMESVMARWSTKKAEIKDVIDWLVMIHVDEPGFEDTLMRLSKLIENLARFDKEVLYPKVQEFATEKDLATIDKNFQTQMHRKGEGDLDMRHKMHEPEIGLMNGGQNKKLRTS